MPTILAILIKQSKRPWWNVVTSKGKAYRYIFDNVITMVRHKLQKVDHEDR